MVSDGDIYMNSKSKIMIINRLNIIPVHVLILINIFLYDVIRQKMETSFQLIYLEIYLAVFALAFGMAAAWFCIKGQPWLLMHVLFLIADVVYCFAGKVLWFPIKHSYLVVLVGIMVVKLITMLRKQSKKSL